MKTFRQFMEQNKLNSSNTKEALINVYSGKNFGQLQQKVQGGEINIGDMKKFANSDELKSGLENVVQGIGKDANINVTQFLKKIENFKLPTK